LAALTRTFHELSSRDREDGRATGQPQGVGPGGAGLCARLKTIQAGTEAGPPILGQEIDPRTPGKTAISAVAAGYS